MTVCPVSLVPGVGERAQGRNQYRGRFAPSPSGDLHFGSLVAAVAGYLRARVNRGQWLLRIDDIDPPRQDASAVGKIQATLVAHGLHWDGDVIYQSHQYPLYDAVIAWLLEHNLGYWCRCTRKQIKAAGGVYSGRCRHLGLAAADHALRLKNDSCSRHLHDVLLGSVELPKAVAQEDFIIKRKDGLYAYHLASVVDDIQFGITEVVRGADLLYPSACQLALYAALGWAAPAVLHVPVAVFSPGKKLSKQGHAKALDPKDASKNVFLALAFLGLSAPAELRDQEPEILLAWAIQHWSLQRVEPVPEIQMPEFLRTVNEHEFDY